MSQRITYLTAPIAGLWFLCFAFASNSQGAAQSKNWGSQEHLMAGVYYLITQEDSVKAEEHFRKAILSSSFNPISKDKQIAAEAFYFLGRIYYERANSRGNISQNIGLSKSYLKKSEEYGIVHDRMHPPILNEINQKYPEVAELIPEPKSDKAGATIEIDKGSYQINTMLIDENVNTKETKLMSNKQFELEGGVRYKMEPDIHGGYRAIYRAMVIFAIGIAIWLIRD